MGGNGTGQAGGSKQAIWSLQALRWRQCLSPKRLNLPVNLHDTKTQIIIIDNSNIRMFGCHCGAVSVSDLFRSASFSVVTACS
jgi:hypothetical protein